MKKSSKSVFLSCTVLIFLLIFSMGAAAERPEQPQVVGSPISTMDIGTFFFCGNEIDLPDSGDVIYGTIDNLTGTETTLDDAAFTALTPGSDYTWWIYYDDTNDAYCLFFDGFVMTTPLTYVFACESSPSFDISITDSTLLGNGEDFALIYTYGKQNLSIDNSTLIQNNEEYGVLSASDSDLTATVNDSILTSSKGDAFVVNFRSGINACALTVTFSGENTVNCFYDLFYFYENNEDSSATLIVNDDFSYTTSDDDAVLSAGDVTINVAEGATLSFKCYGEGDSPVESYGDVAITGGGTVQLYSESNNAVYSKGTIDISDCTLSAITDSSFYGALESGIGINYNDLFLLTPINGYETQLKQVWYYMAAYDDFYVELLSMDESEAYYYDSNMEEMTEDAFEAAIAGYEDSNSYEFYTISTDLLPAKSVYFCPDQSENYVNRNAWADWAKTGIIYVINAGFMGSTSSSALNFDETIAASRAMMAQILYNLAGNPELTAADITTYNNQFSDVNATSWYYDAVVWATNEGYVKGVGGGKFAPNADVTREQAMTMLWRYNGSVDSSYSLNSFSDNDQVSSYAQTACAWAVENGIINGMPSADGTILSPKTNCTRAQMAVILYNYENSLNQ